MAKVLGKFAQEVLAELGSSVISQFRDYLISKNLP
jgi:hypothetical protein